MSDPNAPAGWYPDVTSPGRQRYWDGAAWTEQFIDAPVTAQPVVAQPVVVQPAAQPVGAAPTAATPWTQGPGAPVPGMPPAPPKRPIWPWLVGGGALLLVIIGVIVAVIVAGVLAARPSGPDPDPGPVGPVGSPEETLQDLFDAWWAGDCDAYLAVTTPEFGADWTQDDDTSGFTCESFEQRADSYYGASTDLTLDVTSSDVNGETATLESTESGTDAEGTWSTSYVHEVVVRDGRWLVNSEEFVE